MPSGLAHDDWCGDNPDSVDVSFSRPTEHDLKTKISCGRGPSFCQRFSRKRISRHVVLPSFEQRRRRPSVDAVPNFEEDERRARVGPWASRYSTFPVWTSRGVVRSSKKPMRSLVAFNGGLRREIPSIPDRCGRMTWTADFLAVVARCASRRVSYTLPKTLSSHRAWRSPAAPSG
jgi:hypothetical protein